MKAVIQRVSQARVKVAGKTISHIGPGILVLLGVGKGDTEADADFLAKKIVSLRIMADSRQKMNLSVKDTKGEVLVVSQFTLFANTKKGNRPSFITAAQPERAKKLYRHFVARLKSADTAVRTGQFAAMMEVELTNDGPVTIILDSQN